MIVCGECGATNLVGETFCGSCGASLDAAEATGETDAVTPLDDAPTQVTTACPACGTDNRAGRAFCRSCGLKLEVASTTPAAAATAAAAAGSRPPDPTPAARGGPPLTLVVAAIVAGVAVIAIVLFGGAFLPGAGEATPTPSSPVATPTPEPSPTESADAFPTESPGASPTESPGSLPTVVPVPPTNTPAPGETILPADFNLPEGAFLDLDSGVVSAEDGPAADLVWFVTRDGGLIRGQNGTLLAPIPQDFVPNGPNCRQFLENLQSEALLYRGSSYVICVRTSEGRIGRLDTRWTEAGELRFRYEVYPG